MNPRDLQLHWQELKSKAKQAWPRLTDAELDVINGDVARLIDKVRDSQHVSQEEAQEEVEAWLKSLR
jgi:uncharacterized protein YjbJ (UPF0337 family)